MMRLRACVELGWEQIPCVILPKETPVAKLRAFTTKDNVAFGETDLDLIFSDWDFAMGFREKRLHHKVDVNKTFPKILREQTKNNSNIK